jgi:hypothetical protein
MSKCEWQVSCGHADKLRDRYCVQGMILAYCTGDELGLLAERETRVPTGLKARARPTPHTNHDPVSATLVVST